jgi:hypothetical protein
MPTNTADLIRRLEETGCNPLHYVVGEPFAVSDVYCLTRRGARWEVYFTERGRHEPPIFSSPSEAEACAFFFAHITAMRHEHMVGAFVTPAEAEMLQAQLAAAGVAARIDRILYSGPDDPRYRVFVTGTDIVIARSLLDAAG